METDTELDAPVAVAATKAPCPVMLPTVMPLLVSVLLTGVGPTPIPILLPACWLMFGKNGVVNSVVSIALTETAD